MGRPEDKRVKIPALIHSTRLGYRYMSIHKLTPGIDYDGDTNIFYEQFRCGLEKVNGRNVSLDQAKAVASEIRFMLGSDDLGQEFFGKLTGKINGYRVIDFKKADNNVFNAITELPYENGENSFRPDIVFLINGMPLGFMEVKRQNNKDGIIAERERMFSRFGKEIYKRFVNITQVMVFSNNQDYDDTDRQPIQGSFYATSAYGEVKLNRFREEHGEELLAELQDIDDDVARFILKDNALTSYYETPEYCSSIRPTTPANCIISSLFKPERFLFLLKYGICYVRRTDDEGISHLEKHIMRYPQVFATQATKAMLDNGGDKGVVWHTQGSGKTALAYFLSRYLKDYYQSQGKIARFYFIVDRISLATQAKDEFEARGVRVLTIQSRAEFVNAIQSPGGSSGDLEITVVNLQKFSTESVAIKMDYELNIQRVYYMDEAHRSYNPKGSFLASLMASDPNSIKIGLTGTPLIEKSLGFNTKDIFGEYIHRYFYNQSIADGYTLRLLREEIKTEFKVHMKEVMEKLKELKSEITTEEVFKHKNYVEPLCDYILDDFIQSRIMLDDDNIGAMIVAHSSGQARAIRDYLMQCDQDFSVALVLHDERTVEEHRQIQRDFRKGSIDILIVYNMLLTGFDAPRLKKLYLNRKIDAHNLLQALTRVNRPYKDFSFGYIVDFADITEEFDKTNQAYLNELQQELGDALTDYQTMFEEPEKIEGDLAVIKDLLFDYSIDNVVEFIEEINAIDDKETLYTLRNAFKRYKELRNIAVMFGYEDLRERFDMSNAQALLREIELRISSINLKEALHRQDMALGSINLLLSNMSFSFKKISEAELTLADEFEDRLKGTFESFARSLDPDDPEYVELLATLREKFEDLNIEELTSTQMNDYIKELGKIKAQVDKINERDSRLAKKYDGDAKFVRVHKTTLRTPPPIVANKAELQQLLSKIKEEVDDKVLRNQAMMDNEPYFTREVQQMVYTVCTGKGIDCTLKQITDLSELVAVEYENERRKVA